MPKRNLPLLSIWDEDVILRWVKKPQAINLWKYLIRTTAVAEDHLEEKEEDDEDEQDDGAEKKNELARAPYRRWAIRQEAFDSLVANALMHTTKVVERLDSARGDSTKLLIELQDGHRIETVIMRHLKHTTVCVSSQIGCKMGCRFCATGTMGIIGDLTSGEIIEQLIHASRVARVRNVVFMGMGEPLNNYENVKLAVEFMIDDKRFGLSPRQVTVSTVGVLKNMRRLSDELPMVNLALSLHAPSQSVRIKIVPAAGAHHIDKLLEAVDYHIQKRDKHLESVSGKSNSGSSSNSSSSSSSGGKGSGGVRAATNAGDDAPPFSHGPWLAGAGEFSLWRRRLHQAGVMIEYILIKDINSLEEHAHELGRLLAPRREYVLLNLIPYNPTTVAEDYEPPSDDTVQRFSKICTSDPYRLHTRVRGEKGQDIEGACGQLALVKPGSSRRPSSADIEDFGATAVKGPRQRENLKEGNGSSRGRTLPVVLSLGLPALALMSTVLGRR